MLYKALDECLEPFFLCLAFEKYWGFFKVRLIKAICYNAIFNVVMKISTRREDNNPWGAGTKVEEVNW